MMLISAMYVNRSISVSINCYLSWLAYIKYGGSSEAVAIFAQTPDTPSTVLSLIGVTYLLTVIRQGIADSILVFVF
jgi:hypothetical protein